MREGELEKVMCEFAQKKYDILLCTTIIESGLDLPNANTIIINDCDRFGLAQLYQLRGRVGRSDRQAYCYCFYKQSKEITPEAYKRLNAIKDFTTLGSGYHIALKDIEIRGVGNILGSKQHGHMVNVGFDTYCNLLEECINELKSKEPSKKPVVTTIDLNVTAFIPDEWVGSVEQKILEYKRLSDVKTLDELENMALSLKDRFSKLPESVENLIKLIKLRLLANLCTITLIREAGDTIRVYTPFTLKEWLIIRNTLGENVKKYITFQNPPKH
jgi:transcription-repair coupling factor (superfamily II helicase)